jgi:hypothetical protein
MSDHVILGIMLVTVAIIDLYCYLSMRDIHRITNETLLKVDVPLDLKKQ